MNDDVLEISDLSYCYKKEWSTKTILALDSVSFNVKKGEAFGFLGHNGAGKTTTIKSILGIINPSKGNIKLCGKDHTDNSSRKNLGYLPEQPYFYDYLTVRESLLFYGTLSAIPKSILVDRIPEILTLLNLNHRQGSRLRSLSKGLLQRVALAQAIIGDPQILILDEPFSGLDPLGRKEFREIFLYLKKKGVTILMCSHVLGDVEHICDRASILVQGKLQGIYDLKELAKTHPCVTEIAGRFNITDRIKAQAQSVEVNNSQNIVKFTDKKIAEEALKNIVSEGGEIDSFNTLHTSLEDIFVKTVLEKRV